MVPATKRDLLLFQGCGLFHTYTKSMQYLSPSCFYFCIIRAPRKHRSMPREQTGNGLVDSATVFSHPILFDSHATWKEDINTQMKSTDKSLQAIFPVSITPDCLRSQAIEPGNCVTQARTLVFTGDLYILSEHSTASMRTLSPP